MFFINGNGTTGLVVPFVAIVKTGKSRELKTVFI